MSRKALIVTCVISCIVNLGFVGFFVGKSFGPHFPSGHASTWTGVIPLEHVLRPLGPERAAELVPITEVHRKKYRENLRELRRAQIELYRATVEEPFNATRLQDAQEAFNVLFLAAKARHDQMWLEVAAKLQPEERLRIMRKSMPRRFNDERRRTTQEKPGENVDSPGT